MKVGFIGLGRMGAAMAANLIKAGHEVAAYNRTPGKTKALLDLGARAHTQVSGICHGDAVITMLANDDAVDWRALRDAVALGLSHEGGRSPLRSSYPSPGTSRSKPEVGCFRPFRQSIRSSSWKSPDM